MFELFVGSDAVRRHVEGPLNGNDERPPRKSVAKPRRRRITAVRKVSALALRNLAERLEPSPSR